MTKSAPLIRDVLPDFAEEVILLLGQSGESAVAEQMRDLRIESLCDCGQGDCASFATATVVKVEKTVALAAFDGTLLIDLDSQGQICFVEVLGRPDIKYLLESHEPR